MTPSTPIKVLTEDGKTIKVLLNNDYEGESNYPTYSLESDNLFNSVLNSSPGRIYKAYASEWGGKYARYLIRLPDNSILLSKNEAKWNHIHLSHENMLTEFFSGNKLIFTHLTELEYTFYA